MKNLSVIKLLLALTFLFFCWKIQKINEPLEGCKETKGVLHMANFDDFYGVLSLNALKELADAEKGLVGQNEPPKLVSDPMNLLSSINDTHSTNQHEQITHKGEAKMLIRLWRHLGFRRANAASI